MMLGEHAMTKTDFDDPKQEALIVGVSAFAGSIIPLVPFAFEPVFIAVPVALAVSTIALFAAGAFKARATVGNWWTGGLELAGIGMLAGLGCYAIGALMGVVGA